jgi:hypothetical protein
VLGEGKHLGKSLHLAPVRSTHKMPSKQGRGRYGGLPPKGERSSTGNKSSIKLQSSSVSCDSGSILDPAELLARASMRDRLRMHVSFRSLYNAILSPISYAVSPF